MNTEKRYPCWLNSERLAEAEALLNTGFAYCGDESDFCVVEEWKVKKFGKWTFYTCPGEVAIDAVCQGALYSRCLETDDEYDLDTEAWFKKQLESAIAAIKQVQQQRQQQAPIQLKLFEKVQ